MNVIQGYTVKNPSIGLYRNENTLIKSHLITLVWVGVAVEILI